MLFPDGERFFVKSVHDHAAEITDPALLRDMKAFAGQEGQHANQHERFFSVLEQQGYRIDKVLVPFRKLALWSKTLPRGLRRGETQLGRRPEQRAQGPARRPEGAPLPRLHAPRPDEILPPGLPPQPTG